MTPRKLIYVTTASHGTYGSLVTNLVVRDVSIMHTSKPAFAAHYCKNLNFFAMHSIHAINLWKCCSVFQMFG